MTKKEREKAVNRLVRVFRRTIRSLGRDFAAAIDPTTAVGLFATMQEMNLMLDALEASTAAWSSVALVKVYNDTRRDLRRQLKKAGLTGPAPKIQSAFRLINQQTVEALVSDPSTGFLSSVHKAVRQVRDRMRTIRNQAKLLQAQQRVFDETIARVGVLEGKNINTIKRALVREMVSLKKSSELVWAPRIRSMGRESILSNVANLPFVKVPNSRAKKGYNALRIDHYAETLARTKLIQAETLATRNEMLAFDHTLVQFSRNKPLQDDACYLYIGRVFALTVEGAKEFGVRRVSEIPNGGAPVHPNCTHTEIPYFPQYESEETNAVAMTPPPDWSLNRPFSEVQKEFKRRGGKAIVNKLNAAAKKLSRETGGRKRRRQEEANR